MAECTGRNDELPTVVSLMSEGVPAKENGVARHSTVDERSGDAREPTAALERNPKKATDGVGAQGQGFQDLGLCGVGAGHAARDGDA